ncbi:MAG TPA: hypothetical protein VK213_04000 [Bacteroidales bacterium]|nr:hypothetical protein [Bacteroidales bacterium]
MTLIQNTKPDLYAKIISVLFHPLMMPVYGLAIMLSPYTPLGYLPANVKRLLFLVMFVNNVILPVSMLPFLLQMNFISSWTLREREERAIPMVITTILYATTAYIVYKFPVPHFLKSYLFATFLLSLILTIINFRWKISLHSVGSGALLSIILLLSFNMYFPLFIFLVIAPPLAGMIMSSRLQLRYHNPPQIWGGFFTGLSGIAIFMILLQHLY